MNIKDALNALEKFYDSRDKPVDNKPYIKYEGRYRLVDYKGECVEIKR